MATNRELSFICDRNGERLDVWLAEKNPEYSRTYIQKLIADGNISVNQMPVNKKYKTKKDDDITLIIPPPVPANAMPEQIELQICYEDEDIIVVDKPRGMVVHPAHGNADGTLVNALLSHCAGSLSDINGVTRPGIVHRLDKDTSGLIVVAKTNIAHLKLAQDFKNRKIRKIYHTVVYGSMPSEAGKIDLPIGRHPVHRKKMAVTPTGGRNAVSLFQVIRKFEQPYTWLEIDLQTGRTHQIRVHLAHIGYPVVGDMLYGAEAKKQRIKSGGQVLHAKELSFTHPVNERPMRFESPLPPYFLETIEKIEKIEASKRFSH